MPFNAPDPTILNLTPDQLRAIIEAQTALTAMKFDLRPFMAQVVERMQAMTGATGATIELSDGNEMVYHAAAGTIAPYSGFRIKKAGSLSGLCVATREILISEDTSNDPRVNAEACKRVSAASMIVVPLFRHGGTVGVLKVVSTKTNAFTTRDVQTLTLMAGLLGSALGQQIEIDASKKEKEKLKHQAEYDSLTGLPNRTLFNDRLAHALHHSARYKSLLALMYMDLDRFKAVNDTYGHDAGDILLRSFALRVGAFVRTSDTFARLGGDEFVIILERLNSVDNISKIVAPIIDVTAQDFDLGPITAQVGISIGIAVCAGVKMSPEELVGNADKALYEVKRAGRNGYKIFGS